MFFPLGALGSFGSGFTDDFLKAQALKAHYQAQARNARVNEMAAGLLGIDGMSDMATPPDPGAPSERAQPDQPPDQPPEYSPMSQPTIPGAAAPMQAGMQPGAAMPPPGQPIPQGPQFPMPPQSPAQRMQMAGLAQAGTRGLMSPQPMPGAQPPQRPPPMPGAQPPQGPPPSSQAMPIPQDKQLLPKDPDGLELMRRGLGWLDTDKLGQRINEKYPNATTEEKLAVMARVRPMMTQQAQARFNQVKSYVEMVERMRHNREMEKRGAGGQQATELAQQQGADIASDIIAGKAPPDLARVGAKVSAAARSYMHQQGFDMARAMLEWDATKKQVASLNSAQQVRLRETSVSIVNTIGDVKELARQLDLGNVEWWNRKRLNYYIQYRGNTPEGELAKKYSTMVAALKEELNTVITGGYQPSVASWEQANKQLSESSGKNAMITSLDTLERLMNYRLGAVGQGGAAIPGGGSSRYAPPAAPGARTPAAAPAADDDEGWGTMTTR